jgi:hypothetical protein
MSKPKESHLTAEQLRAVLDYLPVSGVFRWRRQPYSLKYGRVAGSRQNRYGHREIRVLGRSYLAHRLAWLHFYGEWPTLNIDHRNGDPGDNRIFNLREADQTHNNANARKPKHNTSGFKGVGRRGTRWRAVIYKQRQQFNLGLYDTPKEAAEAYATAARQLYGAFARPE